MVVHFKHCDSNEEEKEKKIRYKKNKNDVDDEEEKEDNVLKLNGKISQIKNRMEAFGEKEVIFQVGNVSLYSSHVKELYPRKWIGDNVFDACIHVFNLGSTTKKVISCTLTSFIFQNHKKIISDQEVYVKYQQELDKTYDMVIYPLVDANHWRAFAFDFLNKEILFLDSLFNEDNRYDLFLRALTDIVQSKYPEENLTEWRKINAGGLPKQTNTYNCGVYLLNYIEALGTKKSNIPPKNYRDQLLWKLAHHSNHKNLFEDEDTSEPEREKLSAEETAPINVRKETKRKRPAQRQTKASRAKAKTLSPLPTIPEDSTTLAVNIPSTDEEDTQEAPVIRRSRRRTDSAPIRYV